MQAVKPGGAITLRWKHVEAVINEQPCEGSVITETGGEATAKLGRVAQPRTA